MQQRRSMASFLTTFFLLLILVVAFSSYKKWKFEECKKAGHGGTYCTMQELGCFESAK